MREIFADIYYEHGIFPFILFFVVLSFFAFFVFVLCVQGTEQCMHAFQYSDYCSYCGEQLNFYCPGCGSKIDHMEFCSECGLAVGGAQ